MVVWVEHKNTVHFWFFGVSRYRYKTPINIYSLHAFRTEKDEGEILLPMLPCWQLASGGIMRWLCILYRLFTSFVVNWEGQQTSTISIDFEMQRQPRAISNTWMLHTVDFLYQPGKNKHESVSKIGRTKQLPKTVKTAWGYGTCMQFVSKGAMSNRVPLWYWLLLGPC